jgi:hypothetical protein
MVQDLKTHSKFKDRGWWDSISFNTPRALRIKARGGSLRMIFDEERKQGLPKAFGKCLTTGY